MCAGPGQASSRLYVQSPRSSNSTQGTGMKQVAGLRVMLSAGCLRLLGEVVGIFEFYLPSNLEMGSLGLFLGPLS